MCAGTPTLPQLLKALKKLKSEWYTFGVKLGVPVYQLKSIKLSHNQDELEACMTDMLQYWLDNTLEAEWNEVILTLEESDQIVLAQEIKREYLLSSTCEQEGICKQLQENYNVNVHVYIITGPAAASPAQELVTTVTPASLSPSSAAAVAAPSLITNVITIEADVAVVSNLKSLEASYGHMPVKASRYLQECDLSEVVSYLDSTIEPEVFNECKNFGEILKKLKKDVHIDVFNIAVLTELVKLFDKAELTQEIEQYIKKKDSFLEETTIKEFQRAVVCRVEPIPINKRIAVAIKIPKEKVCKVTLKNIEELAKKGFDEEKYRSFMHLHAKPGCVLVSWTVPKEMNNELQQLAQSNFAVFKENGVVEVTVGGTRVFPWTQQVRIKHTL